MKKGTVLKNVTINMDFSADGATQYLASALLEQVGANRANSEAMMKLAETLKPTDACAVRIEADG